MLACQSVRDFEPPWWRIRAHPGAGPLQALAYSLREGGYLVLGGAENSGLKDDERLDHAVELLVHDLEGTIKIGEGERVSGHVRRIHPSHLQQPQQALQAQAATRAQACLDRFLGHANAPVQARYPDII